MAGSLPQHDFDPLRPFNKFSIFSLAAERAKEREREREKGGPICKSFFFFLAVSSSSYICLDQEESPWQHINVCCLLESCLLALIQHTLNLPFLLNGKVKDCIFHVRKERQKRDIFFRKNVVFRFRECVLLNKGHFAIMGYSVNS